MSGAPRAASDPSRRPSFAAPFTGTLRAKFLLALATISALLTVATLLLVQYRVQVHVREDIGQGLRSSVATFQSLQRQRESTLERSAALLATLPPLKAVMTSQDTATIQDASTAFWRLAGSQLFVLADRSGRLVALHTTTSGFSTAEAQEALQRSLAGGESRSWWFGNGRLFEVFLQPIYFGSPESETPIGLLCVGYEIDRATAADVSQVASSLVAFRYEQTLVATTVPESEGEELAARLATLGAGERDPREIVLGRGRYLATAVRLSAGPAPPVTLAVLQSFDEASAFLQDLNRWILAVGLAAVLAGSALVFVVSTTFTRPLAQLVAGVRALEQGDYAFPLNEHGADEVADLTAAFRRMRLRLQESQTQLLDAERLATIGRMASTISHDLRHPLTAILAYAEFLGESRLTEAERHDFLQEIRIAVNRMTDELNSLLGFSKQRDAHRPVHGRIADVIDRAIQTVKVLPDFESITVTSTYDGDVAGWFDPGQIERVMLNLLFNACEAVSPRGGHVEVSARSVGGRLEIRVADNGPGIPAPIRDSLFQPFASFGKEKGIGLGLTVVQKLVQDHSGEVTVERTGVDGTVFRIVLPAMPGPANPAT